jgi:hypothetical protein
MGRMTMISLEAALLLLKQGFELSLKLHEVLFGWAVAGSVGVETGAAVLVNHPDGSLAIAEGDFTADHGAGKGDVVDGGTHQSGGLLGLDGFLKLFGFGLILMLFFENFDAEIENGKTDVHVGD